MATLGYARVSTSTQDLEIQRHALAEAGCDRVFAETVSGRSSARPALDELIAYARTGDVVVVTSLDRLGRSLKDLTTLAALFDSAGIQLRSLREGIDTTGPTGRLVFGIFAAFAEFEAELIAERTRAGLVHARRRGSAIGRPTVLTDRVLADIARLSSEAWDVPAIAELLRISEASVRRGRRMLREAADPA